MQAKFGLNYRYNILFTKEGSLLSNAQQLSKHDVIFLCILIFTLANDQSLREYLLRCQNEGINNTPTPFGIPRRKLELLFLKMEVLKESLSKLPNEENVKILPQNEATLEKSSNQIEPNKLAMERVLSILDHGREALTANDLEDLCKLEK